MDEEIEIFGGIFEILKLALYGAGFLFFAVAVIVVGILLLPIWIIFLLLLFI